MKRQQEAKANERRKVIAQRTGEKQDMDNMNESKLFVGRPTRKKESERERKRHVKLGERKEKSLALNLLTSGRFFLGRVLCTRLDCHRRRADELRRLCQEYHNNIAKLESDKYDLEYQVKRIDFEIHELSMKVNDMRGKL